MSIIRAPWRPEPTALLEVMPGDMPAVSIPDAVVMLVRARKAANELADLVADHAARRAMGEFP
jgi:hypothetical protein